jgi:hypothetical protein
MVNCSLLRKDECSDQPNCSWVVGKGCRSAVAKHVVAPKKTDPKQYIASPEKKAVKKSIAAPKKTAPKQYIASPETKAVKKSIAAPKKTAPKQSIAAPKTMAANGPCHDMVIVFSGFRDEGLKAQLEALGASVPGSVSGKTTMVVAKDTSKDTKAIAFARENGIRLNTIEEILGIYGLEASKKEPKTKANSNAKVAKVAKPMAVKKVMMPMGFDVLPGSSLSSLPLEPLSPAFRRTMTFQGTSVFKIFLQARHIIENSLTKKHKVVVRGVPAQFLAYSHEDECFLFIYKIKSTEPNADKGSYDMIVAEIKYDANKNGDGAPGFSFLGYRDVSVDVPMNEVLDPVAILTLQYKNDLFLIMHSSPKFMWSEFVMEKR